MTQAQKSHRLCSQELSVQAAAKPQAGSFKPFIGNVVEPLHWKCLGHLFLPDITTKADEVWRLYRAESLTHSKYMKPPQHFQEPMLAGYTLLKWPTDWGLLYLNENLHGAGVWRYQMESMEKTHLCMLLYISLAGGKGMHSRSGASWVILTSAVTTTLSRSSRALLRCFVDSKKGRMYFSLHYFREHCWTQTTKSGPPYSKGWKPSQGPCPHHQWLLQLRTGAHVTFKQCSCIGCMSCGYIGGRSPESISLGKGNLYWQGIQTLLPQPSTLFDSPANPQGLQRKPVRWWYRKTDRKEADSPMRKSSPD